VDAFFEAVKEWLKGCGHLGGLGILLIDTRAQWLPYWPLILPLLTLALGLLLRNGFFWERVPNLRDTVNQLSDPKQPRFPVIYEDALAQLHAQSRIFRRSLRQADKLLKRLYGPSPFGPIAFDRALSIAALYPICILFGVWLISGTGRLGKTPLLPQLPALWRAGVIVAIFLTLLFVRGMARDLDKSSDDKGVQLIWARSKYDMARRPARSFLQNVVQDIDTLLFPWTVSKLGAEVSRLRKLGWHRSASELWSILHTNARRRPVRTASLQPSRACVENQTDQSCRRMQRARTLLVLTVILAGICVTLLIELGQHTVLVRSLNGLATRFTGALVPITQRDAIDTLTLGGSLAVTFAVVAEGRLAGMLTVPAICGLTVISAFSSTIPRSQQEPYIIAVTITYVIAAVLYRALVNSSSDTLIRNLVRLPLGIGLVSLMPAIALILPRLAPNAAPGSWTISQSPSHGSV
jgi:hypothetical protein